MNKFQESENKGRALFKSFLDQIGATGQPTEDSYDRVDYYFQINGKKAVAEIKVRNAFYSDYLIEADKLQALEETKDSEGLNGAFYVCFYGNQMYIFNIKAIKQYGSPQQKYCKRTTMGQDDYVLKDVVLVPTDKATRYDLTDGKWIKSNPTQP